MSVFSDNLKELRKKRGFTQQYVVDRTSISTDQVLSNYENGNREPDFAVLSELATFYGVTTDFLLGRTQEENPQSKEFSVASGLSEYAVSMIMVLPDDEKKQLSRLLESFYFSSFLTKMRFLESTTNRSRQMKALISDVASMILKDFGPESETGEKFKKGGLNKVLDLEREERYTRFEAIDTATQLIDQLYPLTDWNNLREMCADNSVFERMEKYARSIGDNGLADFIANKGEWSK